MTANAGYHAYATGDVLTAAQVQYNLQNQTVMYFATSAARTTALSGVIVEGMVSYIPANGLEYYNGSAWVVLSTGGDITGVTAGTGISGGGTTGDVTVTNAMATSITTKGDLIPGTGSSTYARLAAGADGTTLVADSAATTGLRYQGSMAAGKNFVINGNFDIWARGTSFAAAAVSAYTADRWQVVSGTQTATISQQTTGAPNGSRYVLRNAYTSAASYGNFFQGIETNNALQLSGKTVTFSVKMRKNATLTTDLNIVIAKSATVDAAYSATWTTIQSTTVANASLPTGTTSADWYTASVTATIPNDGTANTLRIGIAEVSTQPSGAYWEISQAQLELGSVATAFSRAGGTIQGELAACQRYYFRANWQALTSYANFGTGAGYSTTQVRLDTNFPVPLRIAPSAIDYPTVATYFTILKYDDVTAPVSAVALDTSLSTVNVGRTNWTVTSGVANTPFYCRGNASTAAYLGWSAEL